MNANVDSSDLVVLSHLRWNFVFQRPQHLMTRFAKHRRVFFVEPPVEKEDLSSPHLHIETTKENVEILIPYVRTNLTAETRSDMLRDLLAEFLEENNVVDFTAWYYNPMYLQWAEELNPSLVIFDCMDELSGFKDCPKEMKDWEQKLLEKAHVVFTGGNAIYQAKKHRHHNIHPFPSSIDHHHFKKARETIDEPADQKEIPHPRIGFYGVIEERIDLSLLDEMARLRPDYHFVMVGPVIRLDESTLPRRSNIHYLGKKDYEELPHYLASWDCAMMPFALNEATRFISPTKTPEFLSAGKPVVSTPVNDVVHPYASEARLIHIAQSADEFVKAFDAAMAEVESDSTWIQRVDDFLKENTWDRTFSKMAEQERILRLQKEKTFARPVMEDAVNFVINQ